MPWKHLSSWIAQRSSSLGYSPPPPLTLVTIASTADDPDASAFYASTEFEMLMEWAKTGQFILAFATHDRSELTLICADPVDEVVARVNQLPLIGAGLAQADIRAVSSLRLPIGSDAAIH